MPLLYTDEFGRPVYDQTEKVKNMGFFNSNTVVKAESIVYQEGGDCNLFVLVKNGKAFILHHWWYQGEFRELNSPWGTNSLKIARKDYDASKHLTQQFHPNY